MTTRILLVESSPTRARKILQCLGSAGLEPEAALVEDAEGLQSALASKDPFDILLCQVGLPTLPLPKVLSQARALHPGLSCVALGAKADEDLVVRALRMGAQDYVSLGRLDRLPQIVRREITGADGAFIQHHDRLLAMMDEAFCLFETVPDGQGRVADLRALELNPAFERLTGLAGATFLGRGLRAALPDVNPDLVARLGAVARSGEPDAEEHYLSRSGRIFSGIAFRPEPGKVAMLFNDVTATRAMAAHHDRLAAAVDQAAEGILMAGRGGEVTYANPALERILGLGRHLVLGRPLGTLLPGLPAPGEDPGRPWKGRLGTPGNGDGRVLDCALAPVTDPSGAVVARVGIVRDVTLEVETEYNLRQMEKLNALGELASGLSHDFNNLLTAILSATELIEWQLAEDSPIRPKLQVIYQAVMRARELNRQIQAMSRKAEEKAVPFDLSLAVKEAARLLRATFPPAVAVRTELASGIWMEGIPGQIHQVVTNLALNALQAMLPEGGALDLDLTAEAGSARLILKDSGRGMEPAVLDRIFEPFFTTQERKEGRGLGLSVVHGILERHKGTIAVRSEPGKGSVFQVTLPCSIREAPAKETVAPGEPTGTERVLLVDDEEVLAALGKQGLQQLGYRVTARTDGREALEAFTHNPQDFDLLVVDLAMPGMSGVELAQRVRALRPDLPVILVTGVFQDPPSLEGMAVPFADVLIKPVSILDLAQAIRRAANLRPAPGKSAEAQPVRAASRILLAEDSQTTRSLLRSWLVKAGHEVEEAVDGQEAWEAFQRDPQAYALLVTDIVMPRLDGLKLARRIRRTDPSLPIVVLSSSEDAESVKEALHLQVDEFLNKPFESRLLVETAGRLCAERARRLRTQRSFDTAQAVRMAQRAMEAVPEKGMPITSLSEPLTDAGGDVFRALRREDGTIFFVLADVAGHSVLSSYAVAAFLGMLADFLAAAPDLRALARRMNRTIQAGPFAEVPICVLFGHWAPTTGRVHLLSAGLPHPLWRRAQGGTVRPVALNGAPLGILDTPLAEDRVLRLAEGDRLLLGSDGFFEALSADKVRFEDLAGPIWETLGPADLLQATNLVAEAARAHAGGRFGDDLLVVALEQPALAKDPGILSLDLPSDMTAIDGACEALGDFLDARGLPKAGNRFDTLLAVREALSNAVIHGNSGDTGARIHLCAKPLAEGGFRVSVLDEGLGFDLEAYRPPDTDRSERGRGIPLIRHFSRRVSMTAGELAMEFE